MSDLKSKLPDLKELGSMSGKLFKDIKTSVTEIIQDYKKKRAEEAAAEAKAQPVEEKKPAASKPAPKQEKSKSEDETPAEEAPKSDTPEEQ